MRDASIYEQSILPIYPNHLIFFGKLMNLKYAAKPIFTIFLSHLHIKIIVMCGTLEQEV